MLLELKNGIQLRKELFLNGKNCFDLIDYKTKNKLFENALSKIDEEITLVAELSKNLNEGLYNWCLTYDNHRADGVIGMVLDYYIIEIITHINKQFDVIKELRIYTAVTKSFKSILKQNFNFKIIDKTPFLQIIRLQLRFKLGPLKTIFQIVCNSFFLSSSFKRKLPDNSALILTSLKISNARLKEFPSFLDSQFSNVYFLDISLLKIKKFNSTGEQFILKPYKLSIFFKAFVKTLIHIKDKNLFIKGHNYNRNGFIKYLNQQSFLQTYFVRLKKMAYEEVFKQLYPKCLVVSSTFGDPQKRMPLIAAKQLEIDTILFSCRPFITKMRAEDRILQPDLLEYNKSTLGNHIYVFDKPSYNHLLLSGILKEKIDIYIPLQNLQKKHKKYHFSNTILLLFAHFEYNVSIINIMIELKEKGVKYDNLLYREHPSDKLTINQLKSLENISCNLECISTHVWYELELSNVLAITSNSTSGIDAISRGATLLWLPYLTEHSIQFSYMMKNLGYIAENRKDTFEFIINFLRNKKFAKKIREKSQLDYTNFIKINSKNN